MKFTYEKERPELFTMETETTGFLNSSYIFRIYYNGVPFVRMEGIQREQADFIFNCLRIAYEKGVQDTLVEIQEKDGK